MAELIGVSAEELGERLRSGQTLAEVAEAQGVAVSDVVALITSQRQERLDAAVADGRLSAEEAQERSESASRRIEELVTDGRPERGERDGRRHRGDAEG